jgi:hypothetical protein
VGDLGPRLLPPPCRDARSLQHVRWPDLVGVRGGGGNGSGCARWWWRGDCARWLWRRVAVDHEVCVGSATNGCPASGRWSAGASLVGCVASAASSPPAPAPLPRFSMAWSCLGKPIGSKSHPTSTLKTSGQPLQDGGYNLAGGLVCPPLPLWCQDPSGENLAWQFMLGRQCRHPWVSIPC